MRWLANLVLFLALSAQAAFVETQAGRRIEGVKIFATADGAVTLVTANGQRMTFRKGQYRRAVADKPRELAQAEKLLAAGQGGGAVALLEKVKADCRFLSWDQTAIRLLANHYFEESQFSTAVAEFQALENPDEAARIHLREAMAKSGDPERVLVLLEEDIATGSRAAAARAYLLRGDLKATKGDTAGARRDWLKVATFFRDQRNAVKIADEKLSNSGGTKK